MAADQKLSVFISSKMHELAEERRAVHAALSDYQIMGWLWEKDAGARSEPIRSTYLRLVEDCDIYLGLFWLGYGPYTIEEYEHARKHQKHCLIYEKYIKADQRNPQLVAFLQQLQEIDNPGGLTIARFTTSTQLAAFVQRDVLRLLTNVLRQSRQQPSSALRWFQPLLPSINKPFIGRNELVTTLRTDLEAGQSLTIASKSIALYGMGGIGKTYLALQLALELSTSFPSGVIWLDFGPTVHQESDAQPILSKLASYAFGGVVPEGHLQPETVANWLEAAMPGRLLVIIDDVWKIPPLRFLNRALPHGAQCLVTTRSVNVARALGNKAIQLEHLTQREGIALLENRLSCQGNRTYTADLEALATLLEGHALALDIAAARIKYPSRLRPILQNLQRGIGRGALNGLVLPDDEGRDASVELTLGLSYALMQDAVHSERQRLFRVLGVFASGSLITAEATAVMVGIHDVEATLEALFDLVDLSLLTQVEGEIEELCFRQHGLLRTYAHALIKQEGALEHTQLLHAQYYTDKCWQAFKKKPSDYLWIERHFQNVLLALHWTSDHHPALFSSLLHAIEQYLLVRGQTALLYHYSPQAIAVAKRIGNKECAASLLQSLGELERQRGNLDLARQHYDESFSLYQSIQNHLGEANALKSLGDLESRLGNVDKARQHYSTALELFQAEQTRLGEANVLLALGQLAIQSREPVQARRYYDEAFALYRDEQNHLGEANVLLALGDVELLQKNLDQAHRYYNEALSLYQNERDRLGEANVLKCLGNLELQQKNFDQARRYYDKALPLYRDEQNRLGEANTYVHLGDMLIEQSQWEDAITFYERAMALVDALGDQFSKGRLLFALSLARYATGKREQGVLDMQEALALFYAVHAQKLIEQAEQALAQMRLWLDEK